MKPLASIQPSSAQTKPSLQSNGAAHMPSVPEHIVRVANLLAGNTQSKRSDLRKCPRHQIVTPCLLQVDAGGKGWLHHVDAYIRNVSLNGMGLLLREMRMPGEIAEIKINIDDQTKYFCGVIIFCRHIEGSVHDIGVQLYQGSCEAQLAALSAMPIEQAPDWYRAARVRLQMVNGSDDEKK